MERIKRLSSPEAVVRYSAERIVRMMQATLEHNPTFSLALAGGSTPRPIYELLATEYKKYVDWTRVHLFWGDERCVPPDDEQSNYRMAREALLDRVAIPPENIHRMVGEADPQTSAQAYDTLLRDFFGGDGQTFDLVLLGMGDDGHTASLFPHTSALAERERWVVANYVEKLQTWRITLTVPAILASANIMFLTVGANKAEPLREVLTGDYQPSLYPAQLIERAEHEHVIWVIDELAGRLLPAGTA